MSKRKNNGVNLESAEEPEELAAAKERGYFFVDQRGYLTTGWELWCERNKQPIAILYPMKGNRSYGIYIELPYQSHIPYHRMLRLSDIVVRMKRRSSTYTVGSSVVSLAVKKEDGPIAIRTLLDWLEEEVQPVPEKHQQSRSGTRSDPFSSRKPPPPKGSDA
jgi:hypothetical protein